MRKFKWKPVAKLKYTQNQIVCAYSAKRSLLFTLFDTPTHAGVPHFFMFAIVLN